jgi:hypothetical protein
MNAGEIRRKSLIPRVSVQAFLCISQSKAPWLDDWKLEQNKKKKIR